MPFWKKTSVLLFLLSFISVGLTAEDIILSPEKKIPRKSQWQLKPLEKEVLSEIQGLRDNPQSYIDELKTFRSYYKDKKIYLPGKHYPYQVEEGVESVDEAIRFLKKQQPMRNFVVAKGMTAAARDLSEDQLKTGRAGHLASDGSEPGERMNTYGTWKEIHGESVIYGYSEAKYIVMGLLVDDGVQERLNRKNLFDPRYRVIGLACNAHWRFQTVCVINYAGNYLELVRKK